MVIGGLDADLQLRQCAGFNSISLGAPTEFLNGQRRRFVERFRCNLDGVPDAARIDERDHACPGIPNKQLIANDG